MYLSYVLLIMRGCIASRFSALCSDSFARGSCGPGRSWDLPVPARGVCVRDVGGIYSAPTATPAVATSDLPFLARGREPRLRNPLR